MTATRKELIVGVVFFAVMITLGVFTIILRGVNPFKPPKDIWVFFTDVGGLREGNVVRIAGLEVGQVEQMKLTPRPGRREPNGVLTHLREQSGVELFDDYKIRVKAFSPLGGKYVDVERGDATAARVEPPPEEPDDVYKALVGSTESELISTAAELVENIKPDIERTAAALRDFTEKLAGLQGTVGKLVSDPTLYDNLAAASASLKTSLASIEGVAANLSSGQGTLGKLLSDDRLYWSTLGTMENVRKVTGVLADEKGKSVAQRLIHDPKVGDDLAGAVAHVESILAEIDEGRGNLGKLVRDDRLYENLVALSASARTLAERLANPEAQSPLGVLLTDEGTGARLKKIISDLEGVTDALVTAKGTLGRLAMDDRLINEAERTIIELRESVEDVREQAPINAFLGAVFSAF